MRRFQFRLERLLKIKVYRELEWQAKLAEKMGHCIRLAGRIRDNKEETDRGFRQRFSGGGALDLNLLQVLELYLKRLSGERIRLEAELEERMREREEVRLKFSEVSREKKVLEKLKERKQAEYYAEQKQEEFKLLDETNSGRIARKKIQGAWPERG